MSGYPEVVAPSFCECGDHAFAPMSRGYVVLVSPEDSGLLHHKWSARRTDRSAVVRRWSNTADGRVNVIMSRLILGASEGQWVDHINGDATDNRRHNVRLATPAQNAWNRRKHRDSRGQFKGVHLKKGRYYAAITANGKRRHLGIFGDAEQAHEAYAAAAAELHGEFARAV